MTRWKRPLAALGFATATAAAFWGLHKAPISLAAYVAPFLFVGLGVLCLWIALDGYRKGDFPAARVTTNREKTPIWFWFVILTMVFAGAVLIVLPFAAALGVSSFSTNKP
jgi:hypothetical protein